MTSGVMNILLNNVGPDGSKGNRKKLQDLATQIGKHGAEEILSRGSLQFTRPIILCALCDYIEEQFRYLIKMFKIVLSEIFKKKKIYIDGIPPLVLSYLNQSCFKITQESIQKDEIFRGLAKAYRYIDYKKKVKRALTSRGVCFPKYTHLFPVDPTNRFLYSEISIIEKYKRLFKELEDTIGRYPTKKDNDYIRMIVKYCRESGADILCV